MTATQFGWLFVDRTSQSGTFSVVNLILVAPYFLFGFALYYWGAARSNDMHGGPNYAWLGFVPLANLWLIFSRGGAWPICGKEFGPASGRVAFDIVLFAAAVMMFSLDRYLGTELEAALMAKGVITSSK